MEDLFRFYKPGKRKNLDNTDRALIVPLHGYVIIIFLKIIKYS